ncbi:MAG: ZIP family metal transporter [Rhodocyclaceae bacterium]|nr:ZIP family metal transporter [Rhodocyclaceae bacterium]
MTTLILNTFAPARQPDMRRIAGAGIAVLGALLLAAQGLGDLGRMLASPAATGAFQGGLIAALATAAGAFPILLARRIAARHIDTLLGFGAGVMLAATAFSLVLPAIEAAGALGFGRFGASAVVVAGLALGALTLLAADRVLPHEHVENGLEAGGASASRVWLFVAAIALHNVPEGLAIGVGFGQDTTARATALSSGIAIQDIPEGLVVAAAIVAAGYGRVLAFAVAAATGLAEPVAAVIGAGIIEVFGAVLPWALAFAGGAMLFVVAHEIIPESQRRGHQTHATLGLVAGFCLMMLLDTALG